MEVRSSSQGYTPTCSPYCRSFLLFIPANTPSLRAVLSYYSSTVTVNSEGDVHVSDDTIEGLGKNPLFQTMFGALFKILRPPAPKPAPMRPVPPALESIDAIQDFDRCDTTSFPFDPGSELSEHEALLQEAILATSSKKRAKTGLLTAFCPDPGYFLAGGIAGVVSRTATAPLDRLKVYLIAQVGVKDYAVKAVKEGDPVKAARTAARPLLDATKAIWKMGGWKSLFAGRYAELLLKPWLTSLGNGLNVVKVMPESAIKFGSYEVRSNCLEPS